MDEPMDDAYFHSMYASDPDPWGFDHRFYERRKYDLTVAALFRPHYGHVFEPGCANGALTERLAPRCDRLTAYDIVPDAVERARTRLLEYPHVSVQLGRLPGDWPDGMLDLVVWSEVAYYLDALGLERALDLAGHHLGGGGELVVVNYTGETNYPLTADEVDRLIERHGCFEKVCALRDQEFRLDVWMT